MIVDETTFDAYRKRVTELERDMEGAQKAIRALYGYVRITTACFCLLVIVGTVLIVGLVMS